MGKQSDPLFPETPWCSLSWGFPSLSQTRCNGVSCLEPPDSRPSPGTSESSEFLALDSAERITWDKIQSQEKQRKYSVKVAVVRVRRSGYPKIY